MVGFAEVGLTWRQFVGGEPVGVAMVAEVEAEVSGSGPWFAVARVAPAGIAWRERWSEAAFGSNAVFGYDSGWLRVGIGAGWSTIVADTTVPADVDRHALTPEDLAFTDVAGAFALAQHVELRTPGGTRAAAHVTELYAPTLDYDWDGEVLIVTGRRRTFVLGDVAVDLATPVGSRFEAVGALGTGRSGATYGELGAAFWSRDTGEPRRVGVRVAAGYGALTSADTRVAGPSLSLGLRTRF